MPPKTTANKKAPIKNAAVAKPGATPGVNLAALMNEAAACMAQQDHGSALRLYRQAVAAAPDNAGAAMGLVLVLNHTGNATEALQWLERLQNSVGKLRTKETLTFRAAVWAQVGLARQVLGQIAPAVDAFEKADKLVSTPELQRRITLLRPLASSPEPVQQLILHARQLTQQNQLDGAVKAYNAALQLHPNSTEALHGLAMLQRRQGQLATALPLLQKAIVLAPDRADYYNDLGMIFQDRGELTQAVSFHKRALKLEPAFAWAWINLGVAYKRLGQHDDALTSYQKALKLQPNTPEVHNNLGNLLRIMGRLSEARTHLQQAVVLRPDYPDAVANLSAVDALLTEQSGAKPTSKPAPAKASIESAAASKVATTAKAKR
jgi:tetratricopeptide (TPR) repeat protein